MPAGVRRCLNGVRPMKYLWSALFGLVALVVAAFTGAIALGGPRQIALSDQAEPPSYTRADSSSQGADFPALPVLQQYRARDGAMLGYRTYEAKAPVRGGSAVLIPGSSQASEHLHTLAGTLARAGVRVYVLDMRGHGSSGPWGKISYLGQLEDDLEDFLGAVNPAHPRTLIGFSASGGFALRFAGSQRQGLFDRYLLLAPTMSPLISPSIYKYSGSKDAGWVSLGLPRLIALNVLNRFGITFLNDLDAAHFRLPEAARKTHTATYSYALYSNFGPPNDYQENIRAVRQPLVVIAGEKDELIHSDRYAAIFKGAGRPVPVVLVPDVGHLSLTDSAAGLAAITAEFLKAAEAGTANER